MNPVNNNSLLFDLVVLTALAAGGQLLQLPTAQAGWRNFSNLSQQEYFTVLNVPLYSKCFFISPANLDALLEDEEDEEERTSKAASRSGSFISALSDAAAAQDFPDEAHDDDDDDLVGMDMDDLGLVNLHMQASKNLDVD